MSNLRHASSVTLLIIVSLLVTLSFGTTLISCNSTDEAADDGGDDDDSSDSDWGSSQNYATGQSSSTDSSGQTVVTSSNLGGDVQFEITGPNGQAIQGMTVEYTDTSDGYVLAFVSDPNGVYQTSVVSFDYNSLSSSLVAVDAVGARALACGGVCIGVGLYIAKVVVAAIFVKSAIDLGTAIYEVAADPPSYGSFPTHDAICTSIENIWDIAGILQGTASLLTFGGGTALSETLGIISDEVTSNVEDSVKEQLAEYIADKLGLDSDAYYSQRYCWIAYTNSDFSSKYANGTISVPPHARRHQRTAGQSPQRPPTQTK